MKALQENKSKSKLLKSAKINRSQSLPGIKTKFSSLDIITLNKKHESIKNFKFNLYDEHETLPNLFNSVRKLTRN